jgi:hypothetical protein
MHWLTISEASRLSGASRTTIYRYIQNGKLSAFEGKIQVSELERVFGTLRTPTTKAETSQDVQQPKAVDVLAAQVEFLQEQLRQAQEREKASQAREERLMALLESAQRALTHQPTQVQHQAEPTKQEGGLFGWLNRR